MPRYFFHVRNGKGREDTEGTVKTDMAAARLEAVIFAGDLLRDYPEEFLDAEDWWIEVADARGLMLFRLDAQFSDSTAVRGDPSRECLSAPLAP